MQCVTRSIDEREHQSNLDFRYNGNEHAVAFVLCS